MSDEKIKPIKNEQYPKINFDNEKIYTTFGNSILAQEKLTYTHGSIVILYIVYLESGNVGYHLGNIDYLEMCLFGGITTTNNTYSGHVFFFSTKNNFHNDDNIAKNLIIYGADLSNSSVLVSGKGSVKINDTEAIRAKDELKAHCTIPNKKFVSSLSICQICYNGDDSYLFVNNIQQY